jgi:type II secretory pathway component GspD/PulD (secretin)
LDITPEVRGSRVTVRIENAEVSEDIRTDETGTLPSDRFPIINRRRVSTTVHVGDGETIVIGGLTQSQKVSQVNKVPLLGDIPLLGWLFRRTETRDQESEVAIFLSPKIVPLTETGAVGCIPELSTLPDDMNNSP